jgi:hypothetical protein
MALSLQAKGTVKVNQTLLALRRVHHTKAPLAE